MKRRCLVRIVSFCLAITLSVIILFVKEHRKTEHYEQEIQNNYSHILDEFSSAVNNISTLLNKARFTTSAENISQTAAELLTEAEICKSSLSQLPVGEDLTVLNRFFSQVGNYALSVSKNLISKGSVSDSDVANIEKLNTTAKQITEIVNNSTATYNNPEYWATELDRRLSSSVDTADLEASFGEIEQALNDYPTLIYDGPYSDHITHKEPAMLINAEEISFDTALKTAANTLETDISELKFDSVTAGNISAYRFIGDGATVAVTRKGGYPHYMRKERNIETQLLNYEQALEKSKRYLERISMTGLKETYYSINDGVCTINFAYLDGKTICYTDLVKVGVAMDNGEIMLYEAGGYLSNHTDRAFLTPNHTEEEAASLISPKLTIESIDLALIPTNSTQEVRCYEFTCTSADGQSILVYINTANLAEEKILILLKSDGGILTK